MPTPELPTTAGTAKKVYDFTTQVFETVPTDALRSRISSLPFRARWTALSVEVEKDGKPRGFFVPAAYFVEVRGAAPDKVHHAYIKQKLSDEWNKWLKELPAARRSDRFALVKTKRTGEEPDYKGQGLGVIAVLTVKG
ncbi:hypothetical protein BA190_27440 [Labrys sp. WJW]|uniref:hypothetical protein n=1 Tax=Labrys sp. WJW TaxID=1737983 RepID=UPI00083605C5|nr:hypothetical protein [Labrys sp. WJW]OCC01698.1 hypothetical protein BA190_27440 [Labrys sp. WJW]